MKELKMLEEQIETRLHEIRNIGLERKQTANELQEYAELQQQLREIHNVMILIDRYNK